MRRRRSPQVVLTPLLYSLVYLRADRDLQSFLYAMESRLDLRQTVMFIAIRTAVSISDYLSSMARFSFPRLRVHARLVVPYREIEPPAGRPDRPSLRLADIETFARFGQALPALAELDLFVRSVHFESSDGAVLRILAGLPASLVSLKLKEVTTVGKITGASPAVLRRFTQSHFPALAHLHLDLRYACRRYEDYQAPLALWAVAFDRLGPSLLSLYLRCDRPDLWPAALQKCPRLLTIHFDSGFTPRLPSPHLRITSFRVEPGALEPLRFALSNRPCPLPTSFPSVTIFQLMEVVFRGGDRQLGERRVLQADGLASAATEGLGIEVLDQDGRLWVPGDQAWAA